MHAAPVISGDTLRLRPHVMADMDAFDAFFRTKRSQFMDVPRNRTHPWYGFASETGSRALCGMGGRAIEVEGRIAGQVAVTHPPHFAETELGWMVFDGYEGRSIAFEAAGLAPGYARQVIQPASLVSYIDSNNTRSIALARRPGAREDAQATTQDPEDVVWRHEVAA